MNICEPIERSTSRSIDLYPNSEASELVEDDSPKSIDKDAVLIVQTHGLRQRCAFSLTTGNCKLVWTGAMVHLEDRLR